MSKMLKSRILTDEGSTITLEESRELRDLHESEFFGYLISLIDEATEDEEERADAKVNLAHMLGQYTAAVEMNIVLEGESEYIKKTFGKFSDDVEIVDDGK